MLKLHLATVVSFFCILLAAYRDSEELDCKSEIVNVTLKKVSGNFSSPAGNILPNGVPFPFGHLFEKNNPNPTK